MSRSQRVVLVLAVVGLASGLGIESSRAGEAGSWCKDLCDVRCEEKDGCRTSEDEGCTCYWWCRDGDDGADICMI